jgi:D-3-phosphoglycerate dehydrogenase / 2-oxoglutarate reductase
MQPKAIVTALVAPFLIEQLQAKNYIVDYQPNITYDDLLPTIGEYNLLITTTSIKIDKSMLDAATSLKFIGRLGSGLEHIDVEYANKKNIKCVSSPEGNCLSVAEHTLGLLLNISKKINKSNLEIKNGFWNRETNRGEEIGGKTIGIIGLGNTGKAFAKLLTGFGCNILGYDIDETVFENNLVQKSTLQNIANIADVISFHLPLSSSTYHFANSNFFKMLGNTPYILNTSRGNVIDTNCLINALKNNTIKAAGLDVLENEKIETLLQVEASNFNWLLQQPNVIITPHIAGYSQQSLLKMAQITLQKLGLF